MSIIPELTKDCARDDCSISGGNSGVSTCLGWSPTYDKHGNRTDHDPSCATLLATCAASLAISIPEQGKREMSSRHIPSDLDGNIERQTITDDETCVALSNTTRVAVIKLLGSMSRDAYSGKGLNEHEIDALQKLYIVLQT